MTGQVVQLHQVLKALIAPPGRLQPLKKLPHLPGGRRDPRGGGLIVRCAAATDTEVDPHGPKPAAGPA